MESVKAEASWCRVEGELQQCLHAEARKCFGTLEGGDPLLAEQASEWVRRKLEVRRAASRSR